MNRSSLSTMAAMVAAVTLSAPRAGAAEPQWKVCGADRMAVAVVENGQPLFKIGGSILGPQFVGAPLTAAPTVKDGVREYRQVVQCVKSFRSTKGPEPFDGKMDLSYAASQTGPKTLAIQYICRTDKEMRFENPNGSASQGVPSYWLGLVINAADPYFKGGVCRLELADGKTEEFALPSRGNTPNVKAAKFVAAAGEAIRFVFDPPVTAHRDQGEVRGWLQSGKLAAGTKFTQNVTVELPHDFQFQPDNPWVKTDDWFELKFDNDFSKPGVIDMNDWQDKPAGKHGWLQEKDASYAFADGTPVKFWGDVTVIWKDDKPMLDQQAAAMAKYGINMARCVTMSHKATGWAHFIPLSDPEDGLKFEPKNLDRYDYAMAKFKENGVYTYISPFYDYHLTPGDRARLVNADELEAMQLKDGLFAHSTYQLSVVCPDLQEIFIQWHVNLLNHTNPYTGLRYADDPAAAIWELNNEDNIFLSLLRMEGRFKKAPTYNKQLYARFAKMMLAKYGSQEGLKKAWGAELAAGESLADATVNPWPKYFEGNTKSVRLADQMYFFYKEQSDYYHKWAKAVRATGYKGVLSAGCWQASNWLGHLDNVRSDWEIGTISRHNYATADLKKPGTGLMSAGFQAVLDRSFIMSEWSGRYRVGQQTDAPMIAAYGMGLQGWDGSNHMAWGYPGLTNFQNGINATANTYDVLSQYAALARMTRRMDVKQGAVVGNRRVSLPALDKGDVGFVETFSLLGGANNKEFNCAVPNAAMVAGRVVVEFVDGPVTEPIIDKSAPYIDAKTGVIRSTTGELLWDTSGEGFFTVNTAGSKAAVGYIGRREFNLGEVSLKTDNPFAHLYVTALGKDETISNAKGLLVTTIARMVDKGTVFDAYADRPLVKPEPKKGPTIIEPVKATFELKGKKDAKVFALDHEGRKPANSQPLPVEKTKDGLRFTVDGAQTKTVYYVVEFGN